MWFTSSLVSPKLEILTQLQNSSSDIWTNALAGIYSNESITGIKIENLFAHLHPQQGCHSLDNKSKIFQIRAEEIPGGHVLS